MSEHALRYERAWIEQACIVGLMSMACCPNPTCMPACHNRLTLKQDKGHGHANQYAELIDQHSTVRAVGQAPPQPITQRAACMR